MLKHKFHAMGTEVELLLDIEEGEQAESALLAVEHEFERLEAMLSRFRPDSELSQLNRDGRIEAPPDLERIIELALEAREQSGGRFDPTVYDALAQAGYDRSFEQVAPDAENDGSSGARCGGRVTIDSETGMIELEPGIHIDLGGIGKGYAVDRAIEILAVAGSCLVNAGGDLAVRGDKPWPVGIEDGPTLELSRGAIATSGRDRRQWRRGGEERHHLIDPASGRPARSDLLRVTAVASSAVEADVLAKTLFLAGEEEAATAGVPAVLVSSDGRTRLVGGL
ncbi:MAG: FAD:protein FMN transferase [Gaiellaceae bacterium]|jgi:thiamine biosynthesis lipoprotein